MVSDSSTGDPETTHLNGADGLWIPPELREFTAQIVIRTPTTTIQHFQSGGGQLDAYYGMVGASHFGDVDEMRDPRNPDLAPNRVSIKPQGEEAVVLEVESGPFMDDEEADRLRTDGGETGARQNSDSDRCPVCGSTVQETIAYVRGHRTSDGWECTECDWWFRFGEETWDIDTDNDRSGLATCPECGDPMQNDEEWQITDRTLIGTEIGAEGIQGNYAHARCIESDTDLEEGDE